MTTFLLGDGHGKDTAGKRSPLIPPGIYEWEFNQDIVRRIKDIAATMGIKIVDVAPEVEAVPLAEKVRRAKEFYLTDKDCCYVAIHSNAIGNNESGDWEDSAQGATAFIHPKASKASDKLAQLLIDNISLHGRFRNRGVREKNLYILGKTPMPAVLTENGFMTHSAEATKLAASYWRDKIAYAHCLSFKQFMEG